MVFSVWGKWERVFGANEKLECRTGGYKKKVGRIKRFSVFWDAVSKVNKYYQYIYSEEAVKLILTAASFFVPL